MQFFQESQSKNKAAPPFERHVFSCQTKLKADRMMHVSEVTSCFLRRVQLLMFQRDRNLVKEGTRKVGKTLLPNFPSNTRTQTYNVQRKEGQKSKVIEIRNLETKNGPESFLYPLFPHFKLDTNKGTLTTFIQSKNICCIFIL